MLAWIGDGFTEDWRVIATPGSSLVVFLQMDTLPNANHSEVVVGVFYVPLTHGPLSECWLWPRLNGAFLYMPDMKAVSLVWFQSYGNKPLAALYISFFFPF